MCPVSKLIGAGVIFLMLVSCVSTGGAPGVPHVLLPPGKEKLPAVIVLHTSGGLYAHEVDYARMLTEHGFAAAVPDYHTTGGTDNIKKAYDLLAVNPRIDPNRIGIVGFSNGAMYGMSSADYMNKFDGKNVRALVSYYIGSSLRGSSEHLPPMLFLHGDLDKYVSRSSIENLCRFQNSIGRTCEAVIFKNTKHAFDQPRTTYQGYDAKVTSEANERAISFLKTHLAPQ